MNNYAKIMEYLTDGQAEKAEALCHSLILETAQKIYDSQESVEDLEDVDDEIGGDAADDLIADVEVRDNKNMNEQDTQDKKDVAKKSEKNTAHLIPAPKPVNKQADNVNNLTPFPKVN